MKWQTRMFEGHVAQAVGVQVPPRAFKTVQSVKSKVKNGKVR